MTRFIHRTPAVLLVVLTATLCGCPGQASSSGAVEDCEKIGQQCKLGAGQLGVCSMDTSGEMRCEPQH